MELQHEVVSTEVEITRSEDLKPQEITFDISTAEVEQPTPSVTEEQSRNSDMKLSAPPSEDLKPSISTVTT